MAIHNMWSAVLLLAIANGGRSMTDVYRSALPLPLTERPLIDDPPTPPRVPSPPPPPPTVEQRAFGPLTTGVSIDARTRIVASMSRRGSRQLIVKLAAGFRAGAPVIINPGSATEERAIVLTPEPFVLTSALRYSHSIGETVVQLAQTEDVDRSAANATSPRLAALFELRDRRARVYHRPPNAPPHREAPLLANLTEIADGGSRFVRSHVGVEAAMALVLAAAMALCALGCILQAACDYSLCCFFRGRKGAQYTPRELTGL